MDVEAAHQLAKLGKRKLAASLHERTSGKISQPSYETDKSSDFFHELENLFNDSFEQFSFSTIKFFQDIVAIEYMNSQKYHKFRSYLNFFPLVCVFNNCYNFKI